MHVYTLVDIHLIYNVGLFYTLLIFSCMSLNFLIATKVIYYLYIIFKNELCILLIIVVLSFLTSDH